MQCFDMIKSNIMVGIAKLNMFAYFSTPIKPNFWQVFGFSTVSAKLCIVNEHNYFVNIM